jgi:hypothetical protein
MVNTINGALTASLIVKFFTNINLIRLKHKGRNIPQTNMLNMYVMPDTIIDTAACVVVFIL